MHGEDSGVDFMACQDEQKQELESLHH